MLDYQSFFDSAPVGMFQCTREGKLLHINQDFAVNLGYESAGQLLAACEGFAQLCGEDKLPALIEQFLLAPSVHHNVRLRRQDGSMASFWLISISESSDSPLEPINGYALSRLQEEELAWVGKEAAILKNRFSSFALLLASTCEKTLAYLGPLAAMLQELEAQYIIPSSDESNQQRGRRQSRLQFLQDLFFDIQQIALLEAESDHLTLVPVDLQQLMHQLHRQAFSVMRAKNISLNVAIEEGLPLTGRCARAWLRHSLLRAMLLVTDPVAGGKAYFSVTKNMELPEEENTINLVFSVSWSEADDSKEINEISSKESADSYRLSGSDMSSESSNTRLPSLSTKEELTVLQFLVNRFGGYIKEVTFTGESRSIQLSVRFEHTPSSVQEIETSAPQANSKTAPQLSPTDFADPYLACLVAATSPYEQQAYINFSLQQSADSAWNPLELLTLNESDLPESSETPYDQDPGMDILLVEDNLNTRLLFSMYLRGTKHRITEAQNGQEGVETFKQQHFDIVFMDMEMPLMDGYQATQIIRAFEADENRPPVPIVAQTAHVLPEFKQQCIRAGCSEFLAKPYSKHALLALLRAHSQFNTESKQNLLP